MRIKDLLDLSGKHALVGGSTSGIGKSIAMHLAMAGARVTLIARDHQKLQDTLLELEGSGHDFLVADYSNPELVTSVVKDYIVSGGSFDILINNTGGPAPGPLMDASVDQFLDAFRMHLVCNQQLTQLIIPSMKEKGWGRIINIISTSVRQPIDNLGVSNTIRGAVGNWAKTLANEVGKHNITVNNILPGPIRTPRMKQIINNRAVSSGLSEEEVENNFANSVPLGRIGEPDEIGSAALFLASNAASYVNGTNLIVDGGRTKCY